MKRIGIIKEYDGNVGTIIELNNLNKVNIKKYLLMKKDILYNYVRNGDIVNFDAEIFFSIYDDVLVARFVKKLKYNVWNITFYLFVNS